MGTPEKRQNFVKVRDDIQYNRHQINSLKKTIKRIEQGLDSIDSSFIEHTMDDSRWTIPGSDTREYLIENETYKKYQGK